MFQPWSACSMSSSASTYGMNGEPKRRGNDDICEPDGGDEACSLLQCHGPRTGSGVQQDCSCSLCGSDREALEADDAAAAMSCILASAASFSATASLTLASSSLSSRSAAAASSSLLLLEDVADLTDEVAVTVAVVVVVEEDPEVELGVDGIADGADGADKAVGGDEVAIDGVDGDDPDGGDVA